jgi:hypothetical protein
MAGETGSPACAMIDARRGELYMASSDAPEVEKCIPRTLEALAVAQGSQCLGDGAVLEAERLVQAGLVVPPADSPLHRVRPLKLIEVVNAGGGIQPVLPSYVRDVDAIPTADRPA